MLIIADENIPLIREAMSPVGDVRLVAGRSLTRRDVAEADVLLVRSVTRVDADLLDGTPVRFVGTATIGTDHIDLPYLQQRGIGFSSAAGSNARSVVEYVVAALIETSLRAGEPLAGKTLGIVGRGNIGSALAKVAPALGLKVLVNDPPLERAGDPGPFVALDDLLRESDFVTFHVPLNREGPDCTIHLLGDAGLAAMKPTAVMLNTSRGPVVDNAALLTALQSGWLRGAILDVWEGEPDIDTRLLEMVNIATPHIAGYSLDGKTNGTTMLAAAVREFFGFEELWQPSLPEPAEPTIEIGAQSSFEAFLAEAVRHSYPILEDDERLRRSLALPEDRRPEWFDRLRKEYPVRREFRNFRLSAPELPEEWKSCAEALGFRL
ncbi:4-phosphoerythronate dehydrogenase [bacterium]|nr:4-phosphoerythronate dehydrogenase [bacterium]